MGLANFSDAAWLVDQLRMMRDEHNEGVHKLTLEAFLAALDPLNVHYESRCCTCGGPSSMDGQDEYGDAACTLHAAVPPSEEPGTGGAG